MKRTEQQTDEMKNKYLARGRVGKTTIISDFFDENFKSNIDFVESHVFRYSSWVTSARESRENNNYIWFFLTKIRNPTKDFRLSPIYVSHECVLLKLNNVVEHTYSTPSQSCNIFMWWMGKNKNSRHPRLTLSNSEDSLKSQDYFFLIWFDLIAEHKDIVEGMNRINRIICKSSPHYYITSHVHCVFRKVLVEVDNKQTKLDLWKRRTEQNRTDIIHSHEQNKQTNKQ